MKECIPIIIPAYEPDERLIILLDELKELASPIIIVNDGSGEEYNALFEEAGSKAFVTILNNEINKGKGYSLKKAFKYCLDSFDELIGCVTADSDGQHTVSDISCIQKALLKDSDALLLGVRDFEDENVPIKSKYGNDLTKKVFKGLYKTDIIDTQTGLRGIPCSF